jgi:hypothetical protein
MDTELISFLTFRIKALEKEVETLKFDNHLLDSELSHYINKSQELILKQKQ